MQPRELVYPLLDVHEEPAVKRSAALKIGSIGWHGGILTLLKIVSICF